MNSINFSFLKNKWPDLNELGKLAEKNLYSDPNTTLFKLRKFGERIVDYIFEYENITELKDKRQFNKLKRLEKEELMDDKILEIFHSLRKTGNEAVHNSYDCSEDAKRLISLAYEAGVWFMQLYDEWDFEPEGFKLPDEKMMTFLDSNRKFITTDPFGTQDKKAEKKVWKAVKKSFRDKECLAYWKYPIFSKRGEDRSEPDVLLVDKDLGLVVLEVNEVTIDQISSINGGDWRYIDFTRDYGSPIKEVEDQLFALLGYCNSERELRRKVTGRSIVTLPNITRKEWENSNLPEVKEVGPIIFGDQLGEKTLVEAINKWRPMAVGQKLDNQKWKTLISVLTGTVLYRQKDSHDNKDRQTRAGVKKEIKEQLHKIDLKQENIGKTIPPGPQRIRGIAGSGKSVLLAQKAAHMHLKNPDWKIALVFFTRSLYDATIQQLDRWMKRFTNGEQGYDSQKDTNLEVLHAWGSKNQAGFYRKVCEEHGVKALGAMNNKLGDRDPNQKLIMAAKIFLQETSNINQLYDAILIDEAQDLVADDSDLKYEGKQPFFWLAYKVLKEVSDDYQRRLIWAYDEAQSLTSLNIPTAPELFGDDPKFKRMVSGFHDGGIRKSEIMHKCYRTPGPILVAAHAIGMGLLREEGMLRGFTRQKDWENVGYEVREGSFRLGNEIVLHRPKKTTPNRVPELWEDKTIEFNNYRTREEELETLAKNLKKNIKQEGLNPSRDILVIALGEHRPGYKLKTKTAKLLQKHDIDIYIPKAIDKNVIYPRYPQVDPNKFWHQDAVTIANIFRAKGNEAYLVYVIGLDEIAKNEADVSLRNQLFVALTRAKGWVKISGIGNYTMYKELKNVIDSKNTFEFEFQRPVADTISS
ncbi:DNA/RNA helicase, superfamily I [Halobacteroides halobius DSM 5150]|uniref:DNA/RNA helicase, superfamily I n=1 Tax=Halobacteroides halobius (strain ATCC 35273 / DSM 5150 / MD-1) TaxID=748449 RepID=L0KAA6_HALHC|nr:ATP-binding domain-containing protein [Halobacteroides halobius]AGB41038.1 DNA/RNA helicase, superfamily I [Halobacteroides halobius DSM 5150]